jgi:hypothetical protein
MGFAVLDPAERKFSRCDQTQELSVRDRLARIDALNHRIAQRQYRRGKDPWQGEPQDQGAEQ